MPLDGEKLDRALVSAAVLGTRLALFQTRADAVNEKWITMPAGGRGGSPVLIEGSGPSAVVKGGAGGKFTGEKLGEIGKSKSLNPSNSEPEKKTEEKKPERTKKQKLDSLIEYQSGNSQDINMLLRGGYEASPMEKAVIEDIDSMMRPAESSETLHRGVDDWDQIVKFLEKNDKGGSVTVPEFVSTSQDEKQARMFAENEESGPAGDPGMIRIDIEPGTKMLNMNEILKEADFHGFPEQKEILLGRNQKYAIKSYDKGKRFLHLVAKADSVNERVDAILRASRRDAVWNEGDHPRAGDGKFGSGGGITRSPVGEGYDTKITIPRASSDEWKKVQREEQRQATKPMRLSDFPIEHVPLNKITATQSDVDTATVEKYRKSIENLTDDELPAAIEYNGKYYISDGHHRVEAANKSGLKTTRMRVEHLKSGEDVRSDAEFNESDHPRAPDGKFGSGGGSAKSLDYKSLKRIGPALGSNPGGRFATPEGKSFYVKQSKSNDHAKNEVTAARLYELAGSPVLRSEPVEMPGGKLGTATEWKDVKNIDRKSPAEVKEAQKDFATHAWLANWDSVGLDYDNQGKIAGKMTTLDVGGSLLYRAQGAPKGDAFGTSAKEWDSLRDPSNRQAYRIFGDMSPEALRESARRVAAVPDADIRRVVEESGPGSESQKKALADLLIARKGDIKKRAGIDVLRADDAGWKESDHPRDAEGKFSSTGGAAAKGAAAYKETLGGKKGTVAGLIKHMLMTGKFAEKDVFAAAQEAYGLPDDKKWYPKWYYNNDLKKKGMDPPPIPAESAVEEEPEAEDPGDKIASEKELENLKLHEPTPPPPKSEAPKTDPAKEALKTVAANPLKTAADVDGLKSHISALLKKEKPDTYFPVKNEINALVDNWDKIQPENQKAVATQLRMIGAVLSFQNEEDVKKSLGNMPLLTGGGLAKDSANKILSALQNAYGAAPKASEAPKAPAYAPKTVVEKAVYEQAKILPHTKKDLAEWHEDATGAMVKSRMRRDTSKIPGDFFAKATSAYGSDKTNGLQDTVDNVMTNYNHYIRQNVLDSSERDLLDSYKGIGYYAINDLLVANKGKMTTPRQKKLQQAIMKSFVPADTPSYRGMNATLKDLSGFDDAEHSVGRAFEHYNFASCSRSESTARNFGEKVMLKFTVPAGANGLLAHQGEREIVLPANGMFRIDKVEQYPTGYGGTAKHLIHCTYLGQKEAE